jgi:phenylalanyl-tRNA synthetase beta chain
MKEPLVERVTLFDVFEGKPIPEGKKSISFRITYRSHEQTLEDDPVNRLHEKITNELSRTFDAVLPG